jgi:hypothetical protein
MLDEYREMEAAGIEFTDEQRERYVRLSIRDKTQRKAEKVRKSAEEKAAEAERLARWRIAHPDPILPTATPTASTDDGSPDPEPTAPVHITPTPEFSLDDYWTSTEVIALHDWHTWVIEKRLRTAGKRKGQSPAGERSLDVVQAALQRCIVDLSRCQERRAGIPQLLRCDGEHVGGPKAFRQGEARGVVPDVAVELRDHVQNHHPAGEEDPANEPRVRTWRALPLLSLLRHHAPPFRRFSNCIGVGISRWSGLIGHSVRAVQIALEMSCRTVSIS